MSTGRGRGALLWVAAVVLMLSAAVHQRLTGPTHPVRGELTLEGEVREYRLPRSAVTDREARVAIAVPVGTAGRVLFKRYPTGEGFRAIPMEPETGPDGGPELAAYLPIQPPAGKLEYRVELGSPAGITRLPAGAPAGGGEGHATVVLRYRGPVPGPLLVAHVAFMFFAVLVGMRAGLAALFAPETIRRDAWTALGLMTVGGMLLGPAVQKAAFGAWWTGFPFGWDLTDNKTLIMWLVWGAACAVLSRRPSGGAPPGRVARATVVGAALVMTVVYVIPHSLRGSELDHEAIDRGVPSADAVRTGPSGPR